MADYDFLIQYFPGKGNVVASELSRKSATLASLCGEWTLVETFRDLDVEIEFVNEKVMMAAM